MSKKKTNIPQRQSNIEKKVQKSTSPSPHQTTNSKHWVPVLVAVGITFLCFTTAINHEFVNWDDDRNFYENPLVQNINAENFWENTKTIFTSGVIGNYNPLTIWTFAIEKLWFGFENPSMWHLNNILLHLVCVFLVFRVVSLLGLGWKGAFIAALLFGIHPMRVESVAWVTERKDVLFGVFYLASLLQYIKYKLDRDKIRWLWMIILFILSLFSKIQAVSLPLSMIAVDYLLDKNFSFKNTLLNKIPFFILSLCFGIYGVLTLKAFGSLATVTDSTDFNAIQRVFVGAFSFLIYIIKWIFPFRMSPLYPYPNHFPWIFYPSMLIVPLTIFLLYKCYVMNKKVIFFGTTFFIVNIIFLLQILGAGQGYLADRFTYIAYLGLFYIVGYYFENWTREDKNQRFKIYGLASIYLVVLAWMTFQQNKIWLNSETLWTHVLKYYKNTTLPYGNRANYYREKKMYVAALADYNTSLNIKDNQPQAYNSRARLFFEMAKGQDTLMLALRDYTKAIEYDSTDGEFWVNRGATFARIGNIEKAIENLNHGLRLKPDHAVGYLNRSIMYQNQQRYDLALADIESYLKLNPNNSDLWYEKGRLLLRFNRTQEAITSYTEALKYPSNNGGLFFYERALAYDYLNKISEAKNDLQQAIRLQYKNIDPNFRAKLGL